MSYMHIDNLDKDPRILEFKRVFAMEKIHGTSGSVAFGESTGVWVHSGGEKHENVVKLFDLPRLEAVFRAMRQPRVVVFGEVYGGRCQGMKATYGEQLRFVAFEVRVGDSWLAVPQAATLVSELGLEFVHYEECSTDLAALDAQRDADSVQAIRNGMGPGHKREGVVLRPPFEVRLNNGERLIAKYKRADFQETRTPRVPGVPAEVLVDAAKAADEWVTPLRLSHVLDKLAPPLSMEHTKAVVDAMLEDVFRESKGEVLDTPPVRKAISKATAVLWKQRVTQGFRESREGEK